MAVLMAGMAIAWRLIFEGMDSQSFFKWVITAHIVAWIFQFIGHGVFESTMLSSKNASLPCWTT